MFIGQVVSAEKSRDRRNRHDEAPPGRGESRRLAKTREVVVEVFENVEGQDHVEGPPSKGRVFRTSDHEEDLSFACPLRGDTLRTEDIRRIPVEADHAPRGTREGKNPVKIFGRAGADAGDAQAADGLDASFPREDTGEIRRRPSNHQCQRWRSS